MDKFKFEGMKEKLKMKLEQIAFENDANDKGIYFYMQNIFTNIIFVAAKGLTQERRRIINRDNNMLNRLRGEMPKESKTFVKVKRIVHAQPKSESTPIKNTPNISEPNNSNEKNDKTDVSDSISFETLHKNVRAVKLPSKNWKIKMFLTEKKKPLKIVFTNKDENERCVSFSYCSEDFVITFSGYTVNLLGAPKRVSSVDDISILLSIIDKVSVIDPILEYI